MIGDLGGSCVGAKFDTWGISLKSSIVLVPSTHTCCMSQGLPTVTNSAQDCKICLGNHQKMLADEDPKTPLDIEMMALMYPDSIY
jgi:hypothetical protein